MKYLENRPALPYQFIDIVSWDQYHLAAFDDFMVEGGGFEPPKSLTTDLQSVPFGRSGIPPWEVVNFMELAMGLEPATC